MSSVVVLGAGMVGSVMAADLAAAGDIAVSIADRSPEALAAARRRVEAAGGVVETVEADLGDPAAIERVVARADVVAGALASSIGFAALRAVIEAGKPFCDICFMAEDALAHDGLARERGVTAIVDCGVAPGMSNMLAGHAAAHLDRCDRIEIYVGGLPIERRWPFEYKAAFSPWDVLEEYTRPARIVTGGRTVVREALSEPELMDLPGVGTVEAFNTDGLRSLADTLDVPDMIEKTLRYPGHIETMRVLRAIGLMDLDPVRVGDVEVRPRDVLATLMFPQWKYAPGEGDLTVMRVVAVGEQGGSPHRLVWDMLDHHDAATDTSSMARTTAFPCTIGVRVLLEGAFDEPGVHAPERLGRVPGMLDRFIDGLAQRGVVFRRS